MKPKVAFVCVHNSCRSQIAEALGKYLASNAFESYSAGTEIKTTNQIKRCSSFDERNVSIDMEKTQYYSKLLSDIPPISRYCHYNGVQCRLPCNSM